ncbi:hybrid sensor histidine kinase/response regulator [Geomonas sp.]|uniref:hybrid sensor histidine kinase/response regulator n=1 Tax=Geomonas sp. TaxID=2651584 RepID=UPI002B47FDDE|nr:hybrid sensor histidine kinase/response regulator [Geomonas sp.]HJV34071.1 hybrid sensor histidine kinase/response regulator [Geomonas sp.]
MRRQNVMIVDDTPANIEVVSESLGDEYEMIFATSGAEALDLIREDKPDLILLDIMMPGMDGYEVCSILKGDPATRDIPVIFVTAMIQEEDEIRGLELGAIDYITKPITPHVVRARVKNHLEMKRYRDLLENLSTAADRTKKEFLRGVSHELRTPLTPIIGMTDLVLTSEEDDEKRKYLSLVQKAAMKLLGLIEDLIETSRLEGDEVHLEQRPFQLKPFLDSLAAELGPLAVSKGLKLSLSVDPELPETVVADQGMLHKVLSVLLGNAVKFTAQGEVALDALRGSSGSGLLVHFAVADTGIGIAEEDLERIFNDFTQSDGAITRAYPGLGLGLTLARRIIELMEGRIWAESRQGVGSIFHVEIPLVLGDSAAAEQGPSSPASA